MSGGILAGGILSRGDFGWGDFVQGNFVWGEFVRGDFVRGDFVLEPGKIGDLFVKYMRQVTKGHLYHLLGVSDYYIIPL